MCVKRRTCQALWLPKNRCCGPRCVLGSTVLQMEILQVPANFLSVVCGQIDVLLRRGRGRARLCVLVAMRNAPHSPVAS